jgi:hypothetical protein
MLNTVFFRMLDEFFFNLSYEKLGVFSPVMSVSGSGLKIQVFWDVTLSLGKWFPVFKRNLRPSSSTVELSKKCRISDDLNPQYHRCGNLKSQVSICYELC